MPYVIKGQRKRFLAVALAACAALPSAAQANVTPLDTQIQYTEESKASCVTRGWKQPYSAIGDWRYYFTAPAGTFTSGATGWQLRNGARLATDAARGTGLVLPAGASAVSPAACVDLNYPHLRFAQKVLGSGASNVEIKVEVTYPQTVNPVWTEVKQFDGYQGVPVASGWRITPDVDIKPEFGGSTWGARYAAFRFTAVKKAATTAEFRVDDINLDPYMRR